jgi:hypothetical protein
VPTARSSNESRRRLVAASFGEVWKATPTSASVWPFHMYRVPKDRHPENKGAVACIVVKAFLPYYDRTKDWAALAWWIHANVPGYSAMEFFGKLAAFNIGWHQAPTKRISSWLTPRLLTNPGMENFGGSHAKPYAAFLGELTL